MLKFWIRFLNINWKRPNGVCFSDEITKTKKPTTTKRATFEKNLTGFSLFFRNGPLSTKTQSFLSPRTEIDSVSVKVDFNSHWEKTETNSVLVLHAPDTGLFSLCYVFEHITQLDWMVWKATNEELKFWHTHARSCCCYIPTSSNANQS